MAMKFKALLINLILYGCSGPSSWSVDSIATGSKSFDTSRLCYVSSEAHPPLTFEMVNFGTEIETFIHLNRFHFTERQEIPVLFSNGKETFEIRAPVYEGGMRLRLPLEATKWLIQALQEGREVAILVDGLEETLNPKEFSSFFAQLAIGLQRVP